MITPRQITPLGLTAVLFVFGTACTSTVATPTTSPTSLRTQQLAISSEDAVQIALAASQDLYDNLQSLGAIGVTAWAEREPRVNPSEVAALFGETRSTTGGTGTSGAWLVQVRLKMIVLRRNQRRPIRSTPSMPRTAG